MDDVYPIVIVMLCFLYHMKDTMVVIGNAATVYSQELPQEAQKNC